jgi:hypothetical protein
VLSHFYLALDEERKWIKSDRILYLPKAGFTLVLFKDKRFTYLYIKNTVIITETDIAVISSQSEKVFARLCGNFKFQ